MPEGTGGAAAPNRAFDPAELRRPDFQRIVRSMEGLLARAPATYLHPSKRWEYPWALERARLAPRSAVLDAGCSASVFPLYLADRGHDVTGLDREPPRRVPRPPGARGRLRYVCGDLAALPFPDSAFEAVFCISVIEHLPDAGIGRALAELRRVVRPGGRILITTDFHDDADAEIWYDGPDARFRVEWRVFDARRLRQRVLSARGLRVDGAVDLAVDWDRVKPWMRRFHGYPYTSVGVALTRI